jgi:hypothetical protein
MARRSGGLRDFDPAHDRSGSESALRRCPLNVRFAPESGRVADIGRRLKRANSRPNGNLRNEVGKAPYGRKSKNRTNGAARYGVTYGRARRPASLYENVIRLPSALTPH